MSVHEIDELDKRGLVIGVSETERRALRRVADRLGVEYRPDGRVRIYPRGFVGSVALSDSTTVRVATKVPVANVLQLASLAYRTLPIPDPVGNALLDSEHPEMDWLALLLIVEIDALTRRGMRQDYVTVQDELPYVRGRLRFDVALPGTRPGLVPCEFADFLPDTPENRLLRATLEVLLTRRLLPGLRARGELALRDFVGVSFRRPSWRLLNACRLTRLNQHYRSAIDLCRLIFQGLGLELESGEQAAPAFFFPMEKVFQEAVVSALRDRVAEVARQSGRKYEPVGGSGHALSFAADIVIGKPPALVIDTKYADPELRNQFGGQSFHNAHLYQAAFYALSLHSPAMLAYPRAARDFDVSFNVEGVSVSIVTIDLERPNLAGLSSFVNRVAAMIEPAAAA